MEIHIQLAGVQLGPYSEKQVREYLQEGLLSLEDPARFDGTETWQTVDGVLNAKPPGPVAPAVPAEALPEKPEEVPLVPPPTMASGTLPLPKTSLRKTAGITTSLLPVPKPLSKDTIRVPIPQLTKSAAQQATVVKKAITMVPQPPPPAMPPTAKSTEKTRTSLLAAVKILAKKPDQEAGIPPVAPGAPTIKGPSAANAPITFPKSPESRTMPLSMVRAIAKKSDIEEKPAVSGNIGMTRPLPRPGSAPLPTPDLARTTLLSPLPVRAKKPELNPAPEKTVPENPVAPIMPDASFASAKLPQTVRTSPMALVRALPKKKDAESKSLPPAPPAKPASAPVDKPNETASLPAVRFVPEAAPLAPGAVSKAPPAAPETNFSRKSLNRTTGSLPSLVKVMAKKPGHTSSLPPAEEDKKEIKPPSTAGLPDETVGGESGEAKPSFFKSVAGKMGMLFRTRAEPSSEPEPEVALPTETEPIPEKKAVPEAMPEIQDKKIEAGETSVIKGKPDPQEKAPVEKAETKKKPELQTAAPSKDTDKPLLGLKTLPPAPEEEDKEELSDADEWLKGDKPFANLKSKPRRLPSLAIIAIVGFVLVAALCAGAYLYVQSSRQAADSLLAALKSGDQAQLQKLIDFPAVRRTLTDEITAQTAKMGNQDAGSQAAVQEMIRNSIDYYVTAEAISGLATKTPLPPASSNPTVTSALASDILLKLNALTVKSQSLVSYNRYVIDLDAAKLDLAFSGTGWVLNQIELNTGFRLPEEPGSAVAPADLGTSLTGPVLETYFEDGKAKFDKQDWDGAIADYSQVLAMNPPEATAYIAYSNRGMAHAAKGDTDAAVADFTQAITLNPKLAEAYFNRGIAKVGQKDFDGALADFSQAITMDPKMAAAYYKRGTIRTMKGDFEGALADFTQDIALDPNSASAYSNRGFIKKAQKDLDGAIQDFTQALAIDPKIVGAYYNRGSAKYEKADLDGAIADFNRALDLDPKMAHGYYSRGIAKNTKNDLDGAIADYNQALTLDPNLVPALNDRALARQAKGDLKGALDDYNRALSLDPKIGSAYYARGLIKEQLNDLDGAIADSSRALDLDPKQAQAYYNRGFAKLVKGNLEGAKADLQKFCALAAKDPYADHARLYLWLIAMAQNPTGTANLDLSDALQNNWSLGPDDLVTKIAQFLLDHESEADLIAAAASPDSKKDAGQHCEIWYFAGMKRLLAGDKTTAIDYFHKCLATGQNDYCEYILAQAELQVLVPTP